MSKFRKRPQQLLAEEIGEIINKDKKKVRQSKKKLKGNTDKMLEVKKSNVISKTIPTEKEKSGGVRNYKGVPSPSSTGFFFNVFFSTTATGFLFCFSSLELKERLKRVFESEF